MNKKIILLILGMILIGAVAAQDACDECQEIDEAWAIVSGILGVKEGEFYNADNDLWVSYAYDAPGKDCVIGQGGVCWPEPYCNLIGNENIGKYDCPSGTICCVGGEGISKTCDDIGGICLTSRNCINLPDGESKGQMDCSSGLVCCVQAGASIIPSPTEIVSYPIRLDAKQIIFLDSEAYAKTAEFRFNGTWEWRPWSSSFILEKEWRSVGNREGLYSFSLSQVEDLWEDMQGRNYTAGVKLLVQAINGEYSGISWSFPDLIIVKPDGNLEFDDPSDINAEEIIQKAIQP